MRAGAVLFFNIGKVVVGVNVNYMGVEAYLKNHGVDVVLLNDPDCIRMLQEFDE